MSDTDTSQESDGSTALPGDGLREGIIAALRDDLGADLVEHHLVPQTDLWVRVTSDAWGRTGESLKANGFDYFCFLSAIDWMPSPYGKGEDDPSAASDDAADTAGDDTADDDAAGETAIASGFAGGDTRFQVFARVVDIERHVGVTVKADVPESMTVPSWIGVYAGANWHERETFEMFGIGFDGHPDLRNLYLPTGFEGHPLRKDFPLLSRMIKPWPGIVDVEPMPEFGDDGDAS